MVDLQGGVEEDVKYKPPCTKSLQFPVQGVDLVDGVPVRVIFCWTVEGNDFIVFANFNGSVLYAV